MQPNNQSGISSVEEGPIRKNQKKYQDHINSLQTLLVDLAISSEKTLATCKEASEEPRIVTEPSAKGESPQSEGIEKIGDINSQKSAKAPISIRDLGQTQFTQQSEASEAEPQVSLHQSSFITSNMGFDDSVCMMNVTNKYNNSQSFQQPSPEFLVQQREPDMVQPEISEDFGVQPIQGRTNNSSAQSISLLDVSLLKISDQKAMQKPPTKLKRMRKSISKPKVSYGRQLLTKRKIKRIARNSKFSTKTFTSSDRVQNPIHCQNCQLLENHYRQEQTNQFLFIEAFAYEKDKVLTEKQSEISLLKIQVSALQQQVNQLLQENESLKHQQSTVLKVDQPVMNFDRKPGQNSASIQVFDGNASTQHTFSNSLASNQSTQQNNGCFDQQQLLMPPGHRRAKTSQMHGIESQEISFNEASTGIQVYKQDRDSQLNISLNASLLAQTNIFSPNALNQSMFSQNQTAEEQQLTGSFSKVPKPNAKKNQVISQLNKQVRKSKAAKKQDKMALLSKFTTPVQLQTKTQNDRQPKQSSINASRERRKRCQRSQDRRGSLDMDNYSHKENVNCSKRREDPKANTQLLPRRPQSSHTSTAYRSFQQQRDSESPDKQRTAAAEAVRARKQQIYEEKQNERLEKFRQKESKRENLSRERSKTRNQSDDGLARPNFYLRNQTAAPAMGGGTLLSQYLN